MLYTIGEIIVFMLVAAIIGFVIGWLARGLSVRSRIEERLEREVAGRQLRINTLENELRDAQAGEARAKEKTKAMTRQLDEQRDLTVTLEARLGEAESASEEFAKRLTARSSDDGADVLAELEDELAAARREAADALAAVETAQSALAERDERVGELEAEVVRLEDAQTAHDAGQDQTDELEALRSAHAELAEQHRVERDAAQSLRSQVEERGRQIDQLQAELEDLRVRAASDEELEDLRGQLAELQEAAGDGDIEALHGRIAELETAVAERDDMLEQLTQPDSDEGPAGEAAAETETPDDDVAADDVRVEVADGPAGATAVDDALADHDGGISDAVPDVDEQPDVSPAEDEDDDPIAAIARRTSGGQPPERDSLQQIKGVGRVLEDLLYSMGITSFKQIANFSDADIDVLNERMGRFKDRMRRDAWMSQAAELHRQVHGTEL